MIRTRFAPSPTGPLHLGHAYSALVADRLARDQNGEFLIRIEDLDQSRARAAWEDQIYDDLTWLGLSWPKPVMRQSNRTAAYTQALDHLWGLGLIYPCTCTRRDIQTATDAPQEGGTPLIGPDGVVYPGTCRGKAKPETRPSAMALRLDMVRACPDKGIWYQPVTDQNETLKPIHISKDQIITTIGDAVVARKDMAAAYHLAVVVDDADQGITHIVRGQDLEPATAIHRVLQLALGLPAPKYMHHALVRDAAGKRLAKRDDARAIATYRADGLSPAHIRGMGPGLSDGV
ncbi:MAG: tRNA glutamyl-Q(34) synthetase GluQRS [Pseudomonadota bacterium]